MLVAGADADGGWRGGGAGSADPSPADPIRAERVDGQDQRVPTRTRTWSPDPAPPPRQPAPAQLPRLLVRDVARDHLVHRLARMPDAFLAHRQIDRGHALGAGNLLNFLA